jgi:hypothetical protein
VITRKDWLAAVIDGLALGGGNGPRPSRSPRRGDDLCPREDLALDRRADVEAVDGGTAAPGLGEREQRVGAGRNRLRFQRLGGPVGGDLVETEQVALEGEPVDDDQPVGCRRELDCPEIGVEPADLQGPAAPRHQTQGPRHRPRPPRTTLRGRPRHRESDCDDGAERAEATEAGGVDGREHRPTIVRGTSNQPGVASATSSSAPRPASLPTKSS